MATPSRMPTAPPRAVAQLRRAWEGAVAAEDALETADGRRVVPRRRDVEALGMVLVWVAPG